MLPSIAVYLFVPFLTFLSSFCYALSYLLYKGIILRFSSLSTDYDSGCNYVSCSNNFKQFSKTLVLANRHGTHASISVRYNVVRNYIMKLDGTTLLLDPHAGHIAEGSDVQ
jgi:hypothetical protein